MLRPWLGSVFVAEHAELIERVSVKLRGFVRGRDSLHDSAVDIDSLLFMAVRDRTKGRMTLTMDNGQTIRVRLNDFTLMADELLYLTMAALPRDERSFLILKEYSLRYGSLSALKALYLHYAAFQTDEEYRTVHRVITTCHPPFRWRGWLHQ